MPVDFGEHGRHFGGRKPAVGAWVCRACGAEHFTPMEQGCPACGAATPKQAEEARKPKVTIPRDRVIREVVTPDWTSEVNDPTLAGIVVELPMMTEKARITVAIALAHYADHGDPNNDQLPRAVIQAWARLIADSIVTSPEEK